MFDAFLRRSIRRLIKQLGDDSDQIARRAEEHLVRLSRRAVPELLETVRHSNPRVRFRAVWILGKSSHQEAFSSILECTRDSDHRVAYDAFLALGELGDARGILPLREFIQSSDDDSFGLQSAARMALTKLLNSPEIDRRPRRGIWIHETLHILSELFQSPFRP